MGLTTTTARTTQSAFIYLEMLGNMAFAGYDLQSPTSYVQHS